MNMTSWLREKRDKKNPLRVVKPDEEGIDGYTAYCGGLSLVIQSGSSL
ncbi:MULTISPECIES: hypothetical protein [Franconibacter]|nr:MULTISPECIES: hypothetical protein [Franconibacter]MEB5922072.1 hypothetical protein [Franconibacter daqui]